MAEPTDPGGIDRGTDADRTALLGVLIRHAVVFVLIRSGDPVAGAPLRHQDIDLTPDLAPENLARLAAALTSPTAAWSSIRPP